MNTANEVRLSSPIPRVLTPVVSLLMSALFIVCACFISAVFARAEEPAPQKMSDDMDAVAALRKMGDYLRTLKGFEVKADATREEVLEDGQKLQFPLMTDLLVRAPDRMRAHVTSDDFERLFFYDAKTFTLWAPKMKFYASVPAPATLTELADHLEQRLGIEMPLADLFMWGKDGGANDVAVTGAIRVGDSMVEGVECAHYAFRQEGLDWQIWIQKGDQPLPRKVVLTTLTDEARPQFTAVYTWNLSPTIGDDAFAFVPPSGAMKVAMARGDNSVAEMKK